VFRERPGEKVGHRFLESRNSLPLGNTYFAFGERGLICGLNLTSRARIALLRALLDVFTVEKKVIPIHTATLENRHAPTLPFLISSERNIRACICPRDWRAHQALPGSVHPAISPVRAEGLGGGKAR